MNPQQTGFDFDLFDMSGFSRPSVEDFEARERRDRAKREEECRRAQEEADRKARERARWTPPKSRWYCPWETLGVAMGSSRAVCRAAWVLLCKENHPDAGGSLELMQQINRAWQDLKRMAR